MALTVKNLPANAKDVRDADLIPGLGRSPGVGNVNLLQYSFLGNSMDRGAWWAKIHGITELATTDHLITHNHTDFLILNLSRKKIFPNIFIYFEG